MIVKTYDRQTAKFLAVIGENMPPLSSDVMQRWIENPKAVQKVLSNAFYPPEVATFRFKVWKTIKLGTGLKTAKDFRHALRDGGFKLSDWVSDILGNPAFTVATEKTEVDLFKVTGIELGFEYEGARLGLIYKRANELGLELCPPEVGPQLRLQYQDQPEGEWILVATEPIIDSDGDPRLFNVWCRASGLGIDVNFSNPKIFWHAAYRWVFCRRK